MSQPPDCATQLLTARQPLYQLLAGLVAYDLLVDKPDSTASCGPVSADAWLFAHNLQHEARIWEDSILLRSYGLVLTLLDIRDRIEVRTTYDDEPDDELDPESFTLRRKKWPR